MERVQFQQEEMLAELKDLVLKGLFTVKESKQIMKKRTAFETSLVRRVAKKTDFLRYAAYEMGLELLRRKRLERMNQPPSPPSISDYALVRRQFHIFERALKKFKSDVGLWIQYIQVAKREGARSLVGRISARALQLHPNSPALYIMAASHELDHLSPSAARTLLQRGIRLNSDSVDMWREYLRMELGFVESLRRRWDVLGIDPTTNVQEPVKLSSDQDEREIISVDDIHTDDAATARRSVMEGAIVKSVINSASSALPVVSLFEALQDVLVTFPLPEKLRECLIDCLHDNLRRTLPEDAQAVKLIAIRRLTQDLEGEPLIEALKYANEQLLECIKNHGTEALCEVYSQFCLEWCQKDIHESLKSYLVSSLRSLVHRNDTSPSLLATHLKLMIETSTVDSKAQHIATKYTQKVPSCASIWLARLDIEKSLGIPNVVTWELARKSVRGERTQEVWMWGLDHHSEDATTRLALHEKLLKESMRDSSYSAIYGELLERLVSGLYTEPKDSFSDQGKLGVVQRLAAEFAIPSHVWQFMFALETKLDWLADYTLLEYIYNTWRATDDVAASLAFAHALLRLGKGLEAKKIINTRQRAVEDQFTVERRWTEILDAEGSV